MTDTWPAIVKKQKWTESLYDNRAECCMGDLTPGPLSVCKLHNSTGILQACQINGNAWVLCTASSLQLWVLDDEHQLNLCCREDLHGSVLQIWPFPDDSLAVLASSAGTVDLHVFRVTDCFHLQYSLCAMALVGNPLVQSLAVDVVPWQDEGNHRGCILSAHATSTGLLVSRLQKIRCGLQSHCDRCFQGFKARELWKLAMPSLLSQLSFLVRADQLLVHGCLVTACFALPTETFGRLQSAAFCGVEWHPCQA